MAGQQRSRPWVVQKYGGTSIGKLLGQIATEIVPQHLNTSNLAVVCSARSGGTKAKGTTALLLEAIHLATADETSTSELDVVIDTLQDEHLEAARAALPSQQSHDLESQIRADCEFVRNILRAAWTVGEISERTHDRVIATGEKLACRIVAAALCSSGVDARIVILDNLDCYREELARQRSAQRQRSSQWAGSVVEAIRLELSHFEGQVPVITGFFGPVPGSLLRSVGRGYSDLCAALCAVALNAQEVQIWKEVDGIFTADPSKVPSARLLPTVTAEEAVELTFYGSEVVHSAAVEQADLANIPLRLKNVKNPQGRGTIIYPSKSSLPSSALPTPPSESNSGEEGPSLARSASFMMRNGYHGETLYRRIPTAVTAKDDINVVSIRSATRSSPLTHLAQISQRLSQQGITVDLISSSMHSLSLAIPSSRSAAETKRMQDMTSELEEVGTVTIRKHMSIISVVGHRMRNMVGTAAEIFDALSRAQVNICLISQGASETNLSFVVRAQDALLALQVVHAHVLQIPLHAEKEVSMIKGPWLY